ncbi:MAG: hypothetical protein JWQ11_3674 [Rhizobacter sp.]|nr:hypothetical protein [Rhizobacter sp.]
MDDIVKSADASNSFAFEAVVKAIRNAVDKAPR